jgi:resuscitation-promoting factor RpfA
MTTPLPPQDPREPDEALPGEAELAALYRQLPQNEPGPALDAAVLRAAAQALETQPAVPVERRKAPREPGDWVHPKPAAVTPAAPAGSARKLRPRWLVGLSSAAAFVLAVGLAWRMHESPRSESAPVASGSVAPVQAEAATVATAATNAPMPPAPLPAPPKQPPPRILATAPHAPMAAKSRQVMADNKQAAPVSRDEQQLAGVAPRAPADVTRQASNEIATSAAKPAVAEAAASAPSLQATMAAAPAPVAAAADTATSASDTPTQELDKIRLLFAQGHDDEARQRLAAFRHAHPRWELPPELQAKLRKP